MNQIPMISRFAPVTPNSRHAFGGVWRLTFSRFLTARHAWTVVALLTLLAVIAGAHLQDDRTWRFYNWVINDYLCFLVPILAFISGAGAMRDDLKPSSIDYVFTRPVRRTAFVGFRYLSHLACAQIDFLLALGVLAAVGKFKNVTELGSTVPILLLGQVLTIVAFTAFGFLCGMITSRYVVIGLLYGSLVEAGVGNIPTQINRLSMIHQVRSVVWPIVAGLNKISVAPGSGPWKTSGILLLFSALMLALTAVLFSQRELAGGKSSDT
jgi:ABC-2 type transport system permease protein